jgi:hypothetical protein
MGLSGGDLTMPELLRSGINDKVRDVLYKVPKTVAMGKRPESKGWTDFEGIKAQLKYDATPENINLITAQALKDEGKILNFKNPLHKNIITSRANRMLSDNLNSSITGYKRYLTPQNINRASALGGIVSGGIAGGNTLRSYGASTLGSLGGLTAGGLTSTGINRALDSYYGDSGAGGSLRRIALDTLIPSLGATAGGYYAGRATR